MTVLTARDHQPGRENLAGLVERVTFHNPDNGFCVLRVKARGQQDVVTVVGQAALIAAGKFVQAAGTWTNDREHGLQFRASFLKVSPPTPLEGIEKYLASSIIRGIGPAYRRHYVRRHVREPEHCLQAARARALEVLKERLGVELS